MSSGSGFFSQYCVVDFPFGPILTATVYVLVHIQYFLVKNLHVEASLLRGRWLK